MLVLFLYCLPLSDTRVKLNAYEPFHKERGEMKSSKFKHTCCIAVVSCGVEGVLYEEVFSEVKPFENIVNSAEERTVGTERILFRAMP